MTQPDTETEVIPEGFTEEDMRLGRRAVRYLRSLARVAVVFCLLSDVITFAFFLPLGALTAGTNKYGGYYAIWMVMIVALIWILMVGRPWQKPKPDDHHMKRGSRGFAYVLGTVLILFPVVAQTVTILESMQKYN